MNNKYCVYCHIVPNGKRYYGMSKYVEQRWGKDGNGYKENIDFYSDILFYGWDNIEHIIVAKGLSKDEAEWLEEELIRENRTYDSEYGYNVRLGSRWTNEEKETMSGINHPMYGKHHTEETRNKISKIHKGKVLSEETKAKISGANHHKAKSVICLTTMTIFYRVGDAAKYYGINRHHISSCCNGKLKSAGKLNGEKLVWRYLYTIEL